VNWPSQTFALSGVPTAPMPSGSVAQVSLQLINIRSNSDPSSDLTVQVSSNAPILSDFNLNLINAKLIALTAASVPSNTAVNVTLDFFITAPQPGSTATISFELFGVSTSAVVTGAAAPTGVPLATSTPSSGSASSSTPAPTVLTGKAAVLAAIAANRTAGPTPLIVFAQPPLNSQVPPTGQVTDLWGLNMLAAPSKVLIGPFVATVQPINVTFAKVIFPSNGSATTCDGYINSPTYPFVVASRGDAVFAATQLAADPSQSTFLDSLCQNDPASKPLNVADFLFWTNFSGPVTWAPVISMTLSLQLSLSLQSKRRQATSNPVVIEVGAAPVPISATFVLVNPRTNTPIPESAVFGKDVAYVQYSTAVSSGLTSSIPLQSDSPEVTVFPISAPANYRGYLPIYIDRIWGPYEYNFTNSIPTLRPPIEAALVIKSNRKVIFAVVGVAGTARNVQVTFLPEAAVTASLSTNASVCRVTFPGLTCTIPTLAAGVAVSFEVSVTVPSYYRSKLSISFTADCAICDLSQSGKLMLQDAAGNAGTPGTAVFATLSSSNTTSGVDGNPGLAALQAKDSTSSPSTGTGGSPATSSNQTTPAPNALGGMSLIASTVGNLTGGSAFAVSPEAASNGVVSAPGGTLPNGKPAPPGNAPFSGSSTSAPDQATPSPDSTTSAPPANKAMLRGIFAFAGDSITCTDPLFGTIIGFVVWCIVMLGVRVVMSHRRPKKPSAVEHTPNLEGSQTPRSEADAPQYFPTTWGVPQWRSLLLKHQWVMMFVPCHEQCVFAHAWGPVTHCLTLLLSTAAILHFIGTAQTGAEWIAAGIAVLVAPLFRPLLNYYYNVWDLDFKIIEAFTELAKKEKTDRLKRVLSGTMYTKRSSTLGSVALDNIELIEEPGEQSAAAPTDAPYLATIARLGGSEKQIDDDVIEFEDDTVNKGPAIVDLHSSGEAMSETITEENPIVPTAAPVVCGVYFLKGHIINAVFGLIVGILTFVTLTNFNTALKCGIYKSTLCWTLIIDAVLVQPVTVGFTGLYRWLTADDEEPLPSELHPFDGALRPVSS
jgi:hypothetical protein